VTLKSRVESALLKVTEFGDTITSQKVGRASAPGQSLAGPSKPLYIVAVFALNMDDCLKKSGLFLCIILNITQTYLNRFETRFFSTFSCVKSLVFLCCLCTLWVKVLCPVGGFYYNFCFSLNVETFLSDWGRSLCYSRF
jgi:hypothetical protein